MQQALRRDQHAFGALLALVAEGIAGFRERDYLAAATAVCALAASADGEVGFEERYAIDAALRHDPVLGRLNPTRATALLDDQLHRLRHDPGATREALERVVLRAGRRPERAVALMRLAWDVITADDTVQPDELAEFERLCEILDVDPEAPRSGLLGL